MHMEMDASSRGGGMEDGGMAPFPATISVPLCLNLEQEIQDGCYKLINGKLQKSPSKPTNGLAAVSVRDVISYG